VFYNIFDSIFAKKYLTKIIKLTPTYVGTRRIAAVASSQGDQIGRFFAHWVIDFLVRVVFLDYRLLFTTVKDKI
jgi:hypothetical protein